jgi:Fe-S-cluster containining protein
MALMTVQITLKGKPLALSLDVVGGKTTLDGILPAMDQLADQVIAVAMADSSKPISCAKGCDTCCRQLVPIAPVEARGLQRLVESMPADRKEEILARFERNMGELRESGVFAELMDRRFWEKGVAREVGLRYLGLNLRCPFLEEGACGIYPHRPIACREYLVTSDPVYCQHPDGKTIEPVMIPSSPLWAKLSRLEQEPGEKLFWIPLIFCLMEAPAGTGEKQGAPQWIGRMFK